MCVDFATSDFVSGKGILDLNEFDSRPLSFRLYCCVQLIGHLVQPGYVLRPDVLEALYVVILRRGSKQPRIIENNDACTGFSFIDDVLIQLMERVYMVNIGRVVDARDISSSSERPNCRLDP